ncbi:MAG: CpsD/CapB family tyrosine-protein kinase [Gammaproteobacteria bacterium]|nr:CpsD/CapB family tyrosine-protein kinase [Gammaproteobacteria bacterium]
MDRMKPSPDGSLRDPSAIPGAQKIVYTQTRRLQTNDAYLKDHRVIAESTDAVGASYKVLRTHVRQRMLANQWQTLAITSPNEGAGKTLTSINLAISLAREVNQTVLLVDLDLRRPSIARYFTNENLPGISDYLFNDAPLSELLFNPEGVERLVVLPGNKAMEYSSETLSSPKMVALAEELKTRYPSRLVLLDMPPLLACDDVLAFSPYFDAALLVVEESATTNAEVRHSLDLLRRTNLLGLALNKSRDEVPSYGYGAR